MGVEGREALQSAADQRLEERTLLASGDDEDGARAVVGILLGLLHHLGEDVPPLGALGELHLLEQDRAAADAIHHVRLQLVHRGRRIALAQTDVLAVEDRHGDDTCVVDAVAVHRRVDQRGERGDEGTLRPGLLDRHGAQPHAAVARGHEHEAPRQVGSRLHGALDARLVGEPVIDGVGVDDGGGHLAAVAADDRVAGGDLQPGSLQRERLLGGDQLAVGQLGRAVVLHRGVVDVVRLAHAVALLHLLEVAGPLGVLAEQLQGVELAADAALLAVDREHGAQRGHVADAAAAGSGCRIGDLHRPLGCGRSGEQAEGGTENEFFHIGSFLSVSFRGI